ncbi:MAG: T9SS type A sorting domain-containing protein, partial [Bacteroidales bacterium]|nr:T9SS type A sorting domain-containing protein [Bacteroidales bacterium]
RFGLSRGNNKLVLENENEIYTAYFTWPYEEMPYRPFIEEGKVWKVGWFPGGINTAMQLDSYFFYGDTVIDNRTCKQMWCRHQYSKEWPSFANARPSTEYVGALYEEGRRVYCTFPGKEQSELLYDFASAVGDTLDIHDESCIVGDKGTLQTETFKGNYTGVVPLTSIYSEESPLIVWYEGLGLSYAAPLSNTLECGFVGNLFIPLSCTAGDEVIYKNSDPYLELAEDLKPEVETTDGAHSYDVKKQQIDFTHTVKTRPKAPQRTTAQDAEEEVTFSGEYSNIELFLNFLPLVGPYTVTLTNEANGKEVYRKEVQTSNTLALQTALLYYSKGTYTLTVENDEEAYTATLHIEDGSGIERPTPDPSRQGGEGASADNPTSGGLRGAFDLSGRQIVNGKPVNGIYIRGGRKIVVSHSPTLLNPSVIP